MEALEYEIGEKGIDASRLVNDAVVRDGVLYVNPDRLLELMDQGIQETTLHDFFE